MLWIVLSLTLLVLGARTALWHLQSWQLREYRFDRMKAWLRTEDGKFFWYPWIHPGLLPRPKLSGRIALIVLIMAGINSPLILATYYALPTNYYLPLTFLLWERTLFIQIAVAVFLSGIPTHWKKQKLFTQAGKIIDQNDGIIRIGITGSYGKSSTKEVLVHLLKSHFGPENILYNPANQNNEIAIARLVLNNQTFFQSKNKQTKKILVIETGAYKKGEIAAVCQFIKPHIGILTGLNQQHIELFGSQQRIAEAKFELPSSVSQKIFFNANSDLLVQLFEEKSTTATKIPLSTSACANLKTEIDHSTFELYGEKFKLPWPGAFFTENALLALECSRELGVPINKLTKYLAKLPPLERALTLENHPQGFTLLKDTYSANPDGVLQAIAHLKNFTGKRIFVGIPLRELGDTAEDAHRQIFQALKDLNVTVFWCKSDFATLGREVLGSNFHLLKNDYSSLKKTIKQLKNKDVVLLESKLPKEVLEIL